MKKSEAAEMIEAISEEMCITRIGHVPHAWITGGSAHNDDRLTAHVDDDDDIIVSDGNAVEPYRGDLTPAAIREYVSDWLHGLWQTDED